MGYSIAQRVLHWAVVLLCLTQIPTSWAIARTHMSYGFLRPAPLDLFLHSVHTWSGWLILVFAAAQLGFRYVFGVPPPPTESFAIARWGSRASHAALYGLLFALPITGTGATYISGSFAPIHRWLTWSLLAVACIHAAAALWHHFVRRNDVLRRIIVPVRAAE
jgi:cytochrome b561